jgi:hypothetical protein
MRGSAIQEWKRFLAAGFGVVTGIDLSGYQKACNCHKFLAQKATRSSFKSSLTKAASATDVIHTDIAWRLPPTLIGYKFGLSFIEDASFAHVPPDETVVDMNEAKMTHVTV